MWAFWAEISGAENDAQQNKPAENQILANRFREERNAALLEFRFILLRVGFFLDLLAGDRVFVDPFRQHQPEVQADDRQNASRDDEDVQSEEARKSLACDDRPAE